MLSPNCHKMLRLTVFEKFTVKLESVPENKNGLQKPFLTGISRPLMISPPEYTHLGCSSTIMQNFTPIGGTDTEISVRGQKNTHISGL